jgi:hypothetical protein
MDDKTLDIPVFVSCPTRLSPSQDARVGLFRTLCQANSLQWNAPQATVYSRKPPFDAVLDLIRQSHGGLILGFEVYHSESTTVRPGQATEIVHSSQSATSAWNQIEAAALLSRELPVLIFKDPAVTQGIFDHGVSNICIHPMPDSNE